LTHDRTGSTIRHMDPDDLDAREQERIRRRDHEAAAEQRDLMKPGMGKVFKQIRDAQRKAAEDVPSPRSGRNRRPKA
jgi:hypothetical protein